MPVARGLSARGGRLRAASGSPCETRLRRLGWGLLTERFGLAPQPDRDIRACDARARRRRLSVCRPVVAGSYSVLRVSPGRRQAGARGLAGRLHQAQPVLSAAGVDQQCPRARMLHQERRDRAPAPPPPRDMQPKPPHPPERATRTFEEFRRRQDLPRRQRVHPDGRAGAARAKRQRRGLRRGGHCCRGTSPLACLRIIVKACGQNGSQLVAEARWHGCRGVAEVVPNRSVVT